LVSAALVSVVYYVDICYSARSSSLLLSPALLVGQGCGLKACSRGSMSGQQKPGGVPRLGLGSVQPASSLASSRSGPLTERGSARTPRWASPDSNPVQQTTGDIKQLAALESEACDTWEFLGSGTLLPWGADILHICRRATPRELTGLTPRELGVSEKSFRLDDLEDSDVSDDDSITSSMIASPRPPLPKTPRSGGGSAPRGPTTPRGGGLTPRGSGPLSPSGARVFRQGKIRIARQAFLRF